MTCKRTFTGGVQSTTRRQNNRVLNVPVAMRTLNRITLAAAILVDSAEKGGRRHNHIKNATLFCTSIF